MDWVNKWKIQHGKRNIQNFYIFISIFILSFGIITPIPSLGTSPQGTNLTIINVNVTPDPIVEGDMVSINVTIQNIGPNNISEGEEILITLKVDNEQSIVTYLIDTLGLKKNQQRTENLTWTATLGSIQRRFLHITLTYLGNEDAVAKTELRVNERKTDLLFVITPSISGMATPGKPIKEELKNNNYYEVTTSDIPWWNTSWHYRRIYNVTGTGNISLPTNFTSILESLNIVNKTFDNASIVVVHYDANGTMDLVKTFLFNESSTFDNLTNSIGTLLWKVPESSLYGVYFDVVENRGIRNHLPESDNLTQSGSINVSLVSTEGWWSEFITIFETFYQLNKTLFLQVYTTAEAKNVTAHFFWNDHPEFIMPLHTGNNLNWSNTTQKLSKRGDWTIHVFCYDDAGYQTPSLIAGFYIGQPDLLVSALAAPTICYLNYTITVTANINAKNTTVRHVDISLLVDNIINQTKQDLTIQKDENRTLQFFWTPSKIGKHDISVRIYYIDSNPGNNMKSRNVTVEGIPDLAVLNISVEPTPVNEGDPVAISAYIGNTGDGNATDYKITLYCEQNKDNKTMKYLEKKNSTTVDLKKNEYKNVTLVWESTIYGKNSFRGEWAIGIMISNTTQTPDKNDTNNYKALFHTLWVIPAERNPPILSNLEYQTTQELGNPFLIRVKATDASGIDTVVISITQPKNSYKNATMVARENDRYEYLFDPVQIGRYTFFIKATDLSPSKNQSIITGAFDITDDLTPPTITFFGVTPTVQIPRRQMEIRCLTTDYSGIQSVELTILFPDNRSEVHLMRTIPPDTKYVYTSAFDSIGRYLFSITVQDTKGNERTTQEKTFWITNDLNDTDSDGMPDVWELLYGLNPYDPTDAFFDADNDGISNLQEYQQGSNPLKKVSSSDFIDQLRENLSYFIISLLIFSIIVILAVYGIRRKKT